jgi:hypothetical protein
MLAFIEENAPAGVFLPEDVRILVAAFDDAWARLLKSGAKFEGDRQTEAARERLAKSIIDMAMRDQRRLADDALLKEKHHAEKTSVGKEHRS